MLKLQSLKNFVSKPNFVLFLILASFFLGGVFLTVIYPIFAGQDEARHYNTIQYLSEPQEKNWKIQERIEPDIDSIEKFNYTQEIVETGKATGYDIIRYDGYDTLPFSQTYNGLNEEKIKNNNWNNFNQNTPVNIVRSANLFHQFNAFFEKKLADQNILVRFYFERTLSVLLGTFAILFAYLIAKNISFSPKVSLLLTAIIAFQPKFSSYFSNINYDALLIPLFFLFTLAGVLTLKNGLNLKNITLLIASAYIATLTKGTGYVLIGIMAILFLFFAYQKIRSLKNKNFNYLAYIIAIATIIFLFFYFDRFIPVKSSLIETFASLQKYADESLTMGRFGLSSRTYWGLLTWQNNFSIYFALNLIWLVEIVASIGVIIFLFSKNKLSYLPEKKFVIFLLAMIVALQLGIRAYDWRIFDANGSLNLGTPGRYFLPNVTAHIILLFVGLGQILQKEKYLRYALLTGLLLMFFYSMHLIFGVILPRYYL